MPNSLNPHKRIHGLSFLDVCFSKTPMQNCEFKDYTGEVYIDILEEGSQLYNVG